MVKNSIPNRLNITIINREIRQIREKSFFKNTRSIDTMRLQKGLSLMETFAIQHCC